MSNLYENVKKKLINKDEELVLMLFLVLIHGCLNGSLPCIVADSDLEQGVGGGGFACPAGYSSFCDFFFFFLLKSKQGGPSPRSTTVVHSQGRTVVLWLVHSTPDGAAWPWPG